MLLADDMMECHMTKKILYTCLRQQCFDKTFRLQKRSDTSIYLIDVLYKYISRLLRRSEHSDCWRSTTEWTLGATFSTMARSSKSRTFYRYVCNPPKHIWTHFEKDHGHHDYYLRDLCYRILVCTFLPNFLQTSCQEGQKMSANKTFYYRRVENCCLRVCAHWSAPHSCPGTQADEEIGDDTLSCGEITIMFSLL